MVMSQESSNPARLLLFGNDAELLETRGNVLRSAGMVADLSVDIDDFKVRITAPGLIYDVIVCCHTVTEAQRNQIIALSDQTSTKLTILECLLSPRELIAQVANLIGRTAKR